jgi:hypothetical protein
LFDHRSSILIARDVSGKRATAFGRHAPKLPIADGLPFMAFVA